MNAKRQPRIALAHPLALDSKPLPHEKLDAFQVAILLVEHVGALRPPRGNSSNLDQLRRASASVANNIAEACGKRGRDRQRFFDIARGSALESAAALRVLWALGAIHPSEHHDGRAFCERLYAMLTRLSRIQS